MYISKNAFKNKNKKFQAAGGVYPLAAAGLHPKAFRAPNPASGGLKVEEIKVEARPEDAEDDDEIKILATSSNRVSVVSAFFLYCHD